MSNLRKRKIGSALCLLAAFSYMNKADSQATPQERPPHAQMFQEADKNTDGMLTLDEITAVRPDFPSKAFTRLDKNNDGKIAAEEFERGHGGPGGPERHGRIRELLKKADTNADKKVTRPEWDAVAKEDVPEDAFTHLDRNGDGVLTREDRPENPEAPNDSEFPPRHGPHHGSPTEMFEEVDTNDDGKVTLEEHMAHSKKMAERHFKLLDENGDGEFTKNEIPKHGPKFGPPPGAPHAGHPDGPPPAP